MTDGATQLYLHGLSLQVLSNVAVGTGQDVFPDVQKGSQQSR